MSTKTIASTKKSGKKTAKEHTGVVVRGYGYPSKLGPHILVAKTVHQRLRLETELCAESMARVDALERELVAERAKTAAAEEQATKLRGIAWDTFLGANEAEFAVTAMDLALDGECYSLLAVTEQRRAAIRAVREMKSRAERMIVMLRKPEPTAPAEPAKESPRAAS